jgi:transcription termination factor Rho
MKTFLIILFVVAAFALAIYVATKFFKKFKDVDGDGIPDAVEDKVKEIEVVAKEVKKRAKRVVEEGKDVAAAVNEVVKQSKDVVSAAKGKPRAGRKPKAQK